MKKGPTTPGVVRPQCLCRRRRRRPARRTLAVGAAVPQGPDLEQPVGRVLDLQCRVLESEAVVQERLELTPDPVAVLAAFDEDMGGERRES